ncbi:MAG: aldehyde dehydrogenase family protein [Chloroflexota bacterium]|nr:aldehyde dehydrogenase family protein [Chloroflexota bacterium]
MTNRHTVATQDAPAARTMLRGAPNFAQPTSPISTAVQESLDARVSRLQGRKEAWSAVSPRERVVLVDATIARFAALAERWVAACLNAKGIEPDNPAANEEWFLGPYTVFLCLRHLRQSLAEIAGGRRPNIPGPVTTRHDGQVVARVFPATFYDRVLFNGLTAEVWMEPEVTIDNLAETQAVAYNRPSRSSKVALVLGAGNVSSIGVNDMLYKLFVEDQVVLFKLNPVNAYLGPLLEETMDPLIERGFVQIVPGGAAEGAYLCAHTGIDEIHITGSDKTFDAIVFGPGEEGSARKRTRKPLLTKRITAELGNVSPVIVVPGPWSAGDLAYHADLIAATLVNNAGFNCMTTRVIVQHESWSQREALLQHVRRKLAAVPSRAAYYPGASERHAGFVRVHPGAEQLGTPGNGQLAWTLISGLDSADEAEMCFSTEAFCSLSAETAIAARDTIDYLQKAVAFVNDKLWGTLAVTILVHPALMKDPAVAAAVEQAIADLRYGTVAVNYNAGFNYLLGSTTWGAFPGHDIYDVRSGLGSVHNALMFDRPQKSVLRAPFRVKPAPVWLASRAHAANRVAPLLAGLAAYPSLRKLPRIIWASLKA